jgi:hypothetical protein
MSAVVGITSLRIQHEQEIGERKRRSEDACAPVENIHGNVGRCGRN